MPANGAGPDRKANVTRALICDDDIGLCLLLADYLADHGVDAAYVHSAEEMLARLDHGDVPDVLVLDLMLPGIDGLTALQRLRAFAALPVIMLSSRGDPDDRAAGLEIGADDYLAKPCMPRELLARIRAVLRRSAGPPESAELRCGSLRADPQRRQAWIDGRALDLTAAEFSVLCALMRGAGQPLTRTQLTEQGLNRALEPFDRAIDVHISRLRRCLAAVPGCEWSVASVRGVGYQLVAAAQPDTSRRPS